MFFIQNIEMNDVIIVLKGIFLTFLKNFNLHNTFISFIIHLLILLYYNNINYFI